MKILIHIGLMCFLLTISSCKKEDIKLLQGCCENEPISEPLGNAIVFVPTVFTPNGDGINDLFYVLGDSIRRVITLSIRDNYGNLVFRADSVEANNPSKAWDGTVNGVVRKGLYSVTGAVEANDGSVGYFESKVCNYPCGLMDIEERVSISGCHFPAEWKCWEFDDGCQTLDLDYPDCFN